jgi:hypothetical protein
LPKVIERTAISRNFNVVPRLVPLLLRSFVVELC